MMIKKNVKTNCPELRLSKIQLILSSIRFGKNMILNFETKSRFEWLYQAS